MTVVEHLVIGSDGDGVVEHARAIATATGGRLIRCTLPQALARSFDGVDVVHIPFTDRLFGTTCEQAASVFGELADRVTAAGAAVSVTVHDVPLDDSVLQRRRADCYRTVLGRCAGVVTNSWHELGRVEQFAQDARSVRVIGLPLPDAAATPVGPSGRDVAVLGFVYPDRGYETVIAELPVSCGIIAIGSASAGHELLPARYAHTALEHGRRWSITGFLPDAELAHRLTTVAVPVAPNTRVSASASINTWIAHGRRPLVARCDYTEEFDDEHPNTVWLYDSNRPGALRDLIEDCLSDPGRTVLDDTARLPRRVADIGQEYSRHLLTCARPRPLVVGDRAVVPDNRWDLVPLTSRQPAISVVIPYYQAQRQLDLVLTALRLQTYPADRVEVIVADDGSDRAPDVSAFGAAVTVLRQHDQGFRAAAARNLGAAAAGGELLLFLDGDTVPEPGYLDRLVRLPASVHDVVATGRRRHADLSRVTADDLADWFGGNRPGPDELAAPEWLAAGYRATGDLRHPDAASYRLIISAVLAIDRVLFEDIGGFDERFVGYGGEDWDLAWRAVRAGGVLAHEPTAVAWHDGPEWDDRELDDRAGSKNLETLRLATLIPDALLRDHGSWSRYPAVVVTWEPVDLITTAATARTAFAAEPDCAFWLTGEHGRDIADLLQDHRIHAGPPPADVLARSRVQLQLDRAGDLSGLASLSRAAFAAGAVHTRLGRAHATHALALASRWARGGTTGQIPGFPHTRSDPAPRAWPSEPDLARVLGDLRRAR